MKNLKKDFSVLAILAILLSYCSVPAWAEWITIGITAEVNSVTDGGALEGKILVGDTITGTYTYDSTLSDTNPSSIWGHYENTASPAGIWLECKGFIFRTNPNNIRFSMEIENGTAGVDFWADAYSLGSYNNLPLSNGNILNNITWNISYTNQAIFSSDALLLTAPDVINFVRTNLLRIDGMRDSNFRIEANVISATLIPEPITIALFALGALMLRKRIQNSEYRIQ